MVVVLSYGFVNIYYSYVVVPPVWFASPINLQQGGCIYSS